MIDYFNMHVDSIEGSVQKIVFAIFENGVFQYVLMQKLHKFSQFLTWDITFSGYKLFSLLFHYKTKLMYCSDANEPHGLMQY